MKVKRSRLVDLEFSRNKQNVINLSANTIAFAISLGVSFFVSPYVVKNLGAEANGFVGLASSFTSYAALIKTALNSIGSRYIILAYNQNDFKRANKYYSSLFYGDLFLSVVFSALGIVCVWQLEHLINISPQLVADVKLLFTLIFANFILNTVATVFSSAPYIKNKIYLQSIRDIQCNLIRAFILVILFGVFRPKIFFLGFATFVPGLVLILYNIYYKMILTPELRVSRESFSWTSIKELVSQGIWNSIASVGSMLLTSLDLLITNLFISESDMGILSVAKSMPSVIDGLGSTMASVFFSAMMIDYANNDIEALAKTVKQSTMLIGAIVTIPLAFLISYGYEFYSLWQPTLDARQLQYLSVLTCCGFILYAGANSVGTIFTVTLHVKERSLAVLVSGVVSICITLLLIQYTNLGIYAVAGVSSIVTTIRMLFYIVPQGARYIGKKADTFIPVVLKALISTIVLCGVAWLEKRVVSCSTWGTLIFSAAVFAITSLSVNMYVVMDKETRVSFIQSIKARIRR